MSARVDMTAAPSSEPITRCATRALAAAQVPRHKLMDAGAAVLANNRACEAAIDPCPTSTNIFRCCALLYGVATFSRHQCTAHREQLVVQPGAARATSLKCLPFCTASSYAVAAFSAPPPAPAPPAPAPAPPAPAPAPAPAAAPSLATAPSTAALSFEPSSFEAPSAFVSTAFAV